MGGKHPHGTIQSSQQFVQSTMRSAYEKGYKVYTLKDCTAATSLEAHEATLKHNFGMFSITVTSDEVKAAIKKQ